MAKYIKPEAFAHEVAKAFHHLLATGFVAAPPEDYRLLFTSGKYSVEVLFDDRDGRVITLVDAYVGRRNPRSGLQCLYVEAGLGPAQSISDIARSARSLRLAVASQASALRELLPILETDRGPALMLACNGR